MPAPDVCPGCGAALPPGTEQCSLCGTPIEASAAATGGPSGNPSSDSDGKDGSSAPGGEAASRAESSGGADEAGVFCNACGWQNPPGANFCSRCGQALQSAAASPPSAGPAASASTKPVQAPPGAKTAVTETPDDASEDAPETPAFLDDGDGAMKKRVLLMVGVAALLVAGLFLLSEWSGTARDAAPASADVSTSRPAGGAAARTTGEPPSADGPVPEVIRAQEQPGEVPAAFAARVDSLQNAVSTQSGRRQRLARRQLAALFAEAGMPGPAAAQQWLFARASPDPRGWEQAGTLLYEWMLSLTQQDQAGDRVAVARLTADAYQRVLDRAPQNHDARTHLAIAYTETNRPMRGINELKRVLQEAPDHAGARFNYGLMQMMVSRYATALEQFEQVREVAGEGTPYYQRAGTLIERINAQTGGAPQDAPMPGAGGPAVGTPSS